MALGITNPLVGSNNMGTSTASVNYGVSGMGNVGVSTAPSLNLSLGGHGVVGIPTPNPLLQQYLGYHNT